MAYDDPILDPLTTQYERCHWPARRRRIAQRWTRYPGLAGKTLEEIAAVLADPDHHDHNSVGADLLRGHHNGDPDATTVLLVAFRPLVLALGRPAQPHTRRRSLDSRAHLWAAVGKLVATTDPDAMAASDRPFMFTLLGRVRRDAGRYNALHTRGYIPVGGSAHDIDHHIETDSGHTDTTEQAGIAAVCLHQIGSYVRRRGPDRWRELVHHAVGDAEPIGDVARKRVHRLRPHLVRLTQAA